MPKIKIPDWSECEDAFAAGVKLNPLQQFVLDNEPAGPLDEVFLKQLSDLIEFVEASAATAPVQEQGGCGNGECNWHGTIEECRMCGSIGPLCPECGDTVEPDAAPSTVIRYFRTTDELVKAVEGAVGTLVLLANTHYASTEVRDVVMSQVTTLNAALDKVKS